MQIVHSALKKFISTTWLCDFSASVTIKTRNGVLLVIPLIPIDFFCFLVVEGHTVLRP